MLLWSLNVFPELNLTIHNVQGSEYVDCHVFQLLAHTQIAYVAKDAIVQSIAIHSPYPD